MTRPWVQRMTGRRPDEGHRVATNLELFFDLCFVVAVAQASAQLHHDLTENHVGHAIVAYLSVFFAIWWAWMNFTWFASAYDTDDLPYRLTTLVQIGGVLTVAAGIPAAFTANNFTVVTVGYVIMRLAMVTQWLRAARADPTHRKTALRYAAGIAVVQVGWIARLALPPDLQSYAFVALVLAELVVPVVAERPGVTTWHRHHIAERYGLFTIIVLGESVLAATLALQVAVASGHGGPGLVSLAVAGLVIVFSMWWLYFDRPGHALLTSLRAAFTWGYGHYVVFGSAAAVGAGLAVSVDYDSHEGHASALTAGYSTAVPAAVFLLAVWALRIAPHRTGLVGAAYPATAVLILATPFGPAPIHVIAVLLAALVAVTVVVPPARSPGGSPDRITDAGPENVGGSG
jgi:low temperature requirement protein LtrA